MVERKILQDWLTKIALPLLRPYSIPSEVPPEG
jgi:hypothetical protein